MCVFVFFSCLSQAELCQGGGARGPTKNGRRRRHLFDASITSINNCKSHIAEWCIRRFASKDEIHHLSEEKFWHACGRLVASCAAARYYSSEASF